MRQINPRVMKPALRIRADDGDEAEFHRPAVLLGPGGDYQRTQLIEDVPENDGGSVGILVVVMIVILLALGVVICWKIFAHG